MARPRQQTPAPPESESTFEQAMDELESIVHALEGERLPLDSLVVRYERGMQLLKVCQDQLDVARQRIELITVRAAKVRTEPFNSAAPATADDGEDSGGDGDGDDDISAASSRPAAARRAPTSRTDDDEIRLF